VGTAAVELLGVTKVYGHGRHLQAVLEDVSFAVPAGAVTVLLGPSGVGKSTVLRILAGLEPPTRGTVRYRDDIDPQRDVRIVFQEPSLLPWLTVAENVRLGLRFRVNRDRVDSDLVDVLLERAGLSDVGDAMPDALSGGQAQRVNLVRALATTPRLLLLDEPFAALDPLTRRSAQQWLRELVRDLALTAVLVTHDLDEAISLGDQLVLLGGRPASVIGQWHAAQQAPEALRQALLAGYGGGSMVPVATQPVTAGRG